MSTPPDIVRSAEHCPICAALPAVAYAHQKYGWPENDTDLPAAVGALVVVRDFWPYGSRRLQLLRCPICQTGYLYRSDYEYLVNGSEDEQFLQRLPDATAAAYESGEGPTDNFPSRGEAEE